MITEIRLDNIWPTVEVGLFSKDSEVWNRELSLYKGRKYLVKSPSGRGKTSLVAFLYGLRKDYSGEIFFDSKETRDFSISEWTRLRSQSLSVVYQDLRLFDQLTALDNLILKQKISPKVDRQRILEMAEYLGVDPLLNKRCDTLSFGEQQRIAIIRSLISDFDFLIMDEPFSHLDTDNTAKALDLIYNACEERDASLILTSLGDDFGRVFDKTIVI